MVRGRFLAFMSVKEGSLRIKGVSYLGVEAPKIMIRSKGNKRSNDFFIHTSPK